MAFSGDPNRDYVLKTVKQRDIHFIRLWFTDVLGQMKSFAITPSELELAFEEGMGFDGSAIQGFAHSVDSELLAIPDADTFQVLPWRPEDDGVARMFCTIRTPDGKPSPSDPRHTLRRMLDKAADMGFELNIGVKGEYFYFEDNKKPVPIDQGGYFDLTPLDNATDLRRDTVLTLEQMGIPVEYSHHESAPSQQEIHLRYSDALSMADAIMTYKLVVKEIALKHGVYASFMPKPIAGINGSGMHVHQSLFAGDDNIFFDPDGECGLSKTAWRYIAGQLKYAPEFTLITNQYVNSYKRLVPGFEAPVYVGWSKSNRSSLVRVPRYKPGKDASARFELRSPDPACNPYLVFAVLLAAGLKGIEEELEVPAPLDEAPKTSAYGVRSEADVELLPSNLGSATERFACSELMREVLGEQAHRFIAEHKQAEWDAYCAQVTQWEIDRHYPVL